MDKNKLIEELTLDEGKKKAAYQDSLGYWTIGVGRLIDGRKGGGLSDDEINYLLSNDINRVIKELTESLPWWTTLSENRQRVLVNMCFNLGITKLLGFKNTLAHMKAGNYEKAAQGMLASLWAKQVGKRADRLAAIMRAG